ncbi:MULTISPECIES: 50S ribosomal protein L23 [Gammaproteobacteria]|jgi:large subunit ribosomal protein L23|uniref:Large ribosomal subunit protein uL23 n=2 Tax=Halomonadaceae TaxID=28256 RepID=A0A2A2EV37_9GAMM|nr:MULTISPECIES: 50S ribosomal protein L23 [Gammaproteobacteria]KAA8982592.1 50S ribosomal protein L23 [Halospina sp. K52047b]MYL27592.1 50S ribosomal protein L23 [Halomonas utahensis]MYL75929.1 50S ribosomal protein L23 [Halomonas sp. 22501_18_FS]PAU76334.1 50S ribosomal protein L23 [Halovibrio salipaludis]|tara:strand:- start:146 stop:439 length:294 start_codon:yes stop_codon:yes gene_type:complete
MNQERIYKVLLGPLVSEKATMVGDQGQVVFKVAPDATKPEIRKAVEQLFNVDVTKVQVSNRKGKNKRTIHGMGKRDDLRKAYVRLADGQDIDFMDVE